MYAFLLQSFVSNLEKGTAAKANSAAAAGPATKKVISTSFTLSSLTLTATTLQKPGPKKPTKSKKDDWSWIDSIPDVLAVMAKALRLRTQTIWQTTQERDNFVSSVEPFFSNRIFFDS